MNLRHTFIVCTVFIPLFKNWICFNVIKLIMSIIYNFTCNWDWFPRLKMYPTEMCSSIIVFRWQCLYIFILLTNFFKVHFESVSVLMVIAHFNVVFVLQPSLVVIFFFFWLHAVFVSLIEHRISNLWFYFYRILWFYTNWYRCAPQPSLLIVPT